MRNIPEPQPLPRHPRFLNLTGETFGRLRVLHYVGRRGAHTTWACECDCGTKTLVRTGHLRTGATKSCGCISQERRLRGTHGASCTPEYITWHNIKARCYNPRDDSYYRYGGRGIKMCQRWKDSFQNFLDDIGARPTLKHSIERIDNDGPYAPHNCYWASKTEQARNKVTTRMLTYRGVTKPLPVWADITNLPREAIRLRLKRGWSIEAALETPLQTPK